MPLPPSKPPKPPKPPPLPSLRLVSNRPRSHRPRSQIAQLLHKIESLDEEERRLVLYHGLEGMAFPAVAELLGTTEEAAKKRWQRVRARLQGM